MIQSTTRKNSSNIQIENATTHGSEREIAALMRAKRTETERGEERKGRGRSISPSRPFLAGERDRGREKGRGIGREKRENAVVPCKGEALAQLHLYQRHAHLLHAPGLPGRLLGSGAHEPMDRLTGSASRTRHAQVHAASPVILFAAFVLLPSQSGRRLNG
jgi:hypothetical protein